MAALTVTATLAATSQTAAALPTGSVAVGRTATPTGLIAVHDNEDVKLDWATSTGAVEYAIWRNGNWYDWVPAPTITYTDNEPISGARYQLRALGADGSWSTWTNPVVPGAVLSTPSIPPDLTVVHDDGHVKLDWATSTGAVEYAIWRDGKWYDWVPAPTTNYSDTQPISGARYQLRALGADGSWSTWTNPIEATDSDGDGGVRCGDVITEGGVYDVTSDLVCDGPLLTISYPATPVEIRLNGHTVTGPASSTAITSGSDDNRVTVTGGGGLITGYEVTYDWISPPHTVAISDLTSHGSIRAGQLEATNIRVDMRGIASCGFESQFYRGRLIDSEVTGSGLAGVCGAALDVVSSTISGNKIGIWSAPDEFEGDLVLTDSTVSDNTTFGVYLRTIRSTITGTTISGNGASGIGLEVSTYSDLNCGGCNGNFNYTNLTVEDSVISRNGHHPVPLLAMSTNPTGAFDTSDIAGDDGITAVNPWEPNVIGAVGEEIRHSTLTVALKNVSLTDNGDAGAQVTGFETVTSAVNVISSGNGGAVQCIGIDCG